MTRPTLLVPALSALAALLTTLTAVRTADAAAGAAASPAALAQIAFAHGDSLYTISPDGSQLHRLHYGSWPAYAPDGQTLAYYSAQGDGLYLLDVQSGRVLRRLSQGFDVQPAFSPDGRLIAFARNLPGAGLEIYTLRLADGKLTRVTHDRVQEGDPAYSPDGRYLAYTKAVDGNRRTVVVLASRQGRPARALVTGTQPDFAPDARAIAYTTPRQHVAIVDLAAGAQPRDLGPGFRPAFAPDGRSLAFVSRAGDAEERGDLWRMQLDGSGRSRLTQLPPADEPAWRPACRLCLTPATRP